MQTAVISLPYRLAQEQHQQASEIHDMTPVFWLAGVSTLLLIGWAVFSFFQPEALDTLNLCMPISVAACCLWGIVNLVRTNALWMWSPLTSLLAAFAVFHGLGPLVHVLGDPAAIVYANQFSRIDSETLASTNRLNAASLALVLSSFAAFFYISRRFFSKGGNLPARATKGLSSWTLGIVALSIPLKYFVVLPYFLGWTDPSFVLPGFIVTLGNLSFLCLFLLFYQAWTRNSLFYIPAGVLFVLEIVTGLLSFNKSEIIITLGVCFLGLYLAKPAKRFAVVAVAVIAFAYFVITPIVSKGRGYLKANPATLSDRLDALEAAWGGDEEAQAGNVEGWWTRLCYANAQSFAMHQYEAGMNGASFDLILPAIVPRVLWPDKPIITPGYEFNALATGNKRSSSAPGIFAEAYWNFGWLGVAGACAYVGLLLCWFTVMAFRHVPRRDLRWLPFGVGALLTGASITDWFAATYVGGVITIAAYLAVVKAIVPGPVEQEGGAL